MDTLLGGQDPNDPTAIPPISGRELLFRTIEGALPPPGRLRVPGDIGSRAAAVAGRLVTSFAGGLADSLEAQRTDPARRDAALIKQAIEAGRSTDVPAEPQLFAPFNQQQVDPSRATFEPLRMKQRNFFTFNDFVRAIEDPEGQVAALRAREAIEPAFVSPKPEAFTLTRGQQRFEQVPGGRPRLVAEGPAEDLVQVDLGPLSVGFRRKGSAEIIATVPKTRLPRDRDIHVLLRDDGSIEAVDKATGQTLWRRDPQFALPVLPEAQGPELPQGKLSLSDLPQPLREILPQPVRNVFEQQGIPAWAERSLRGEGIRNADGSFSTVRTATFTDDQGRGILVPTIRKVNGQLVQLDDDEALTAARVNNDALVFPTEEEATLFGKLFSDVRRPRVFEGPTGQTTNQQRIARLQAEIERLDNREQELLQSTRLTVPQREANLKQLRERRDSFVKRLEKLQEAAGDTDVKPRSAGTRREALAQERGFPTYFSAPPDLKREIEQIIAREGEEPVQPRSAGADREALAQERGFPTFFAAPPEVKAEINKQVAQKPPRTFSAGQFAERMAQSLGHPNYFSAPSEVKKTIDRAEQVEKRGTLGTPSDLSVASIVTGRPIRSLTELSPEENSDLLLFKGAEQKVRQEMLALQLEAQRNGQDVTLKDVFDQALLNSKELGRERLKLARQTAERNKKLLELQRQRLALAKRKADRIPAKDREFFQGNGVSISQLGAIKEAFENTEAFRTGSISGTLRGHLATNSTATAIANMTNLPLGGLTGAENDFATKYNALLGRLRQFSGDPRFSDQDAARTLAAIGSAIQGRRFSQQLEAMQRILLADRIFNMRMLKAAGFEFDETQLELPSRAEVGQEVDTLLQRFNRPATEDEAAERILRDNPDIDEEDLQRRVNELMGR